MAGVMLAVALLAGEARCHTSGCRVASLKRYRDSSCVEEEPLTHEEERYVALWNGLIASQSCEYIHSDGMSPIKLRVDCLDDRSIRFGYHNLFADDNGCEKHATSPEFATSQILHDNVCHQISSQFYYKVNIVAAPPIKARTRTLASTSIYDVNPKPIIAENV